MFHNGVAIGEYVFLPQPFKVEGRECHWFAQFYPTGTAYFCRDIFEVNDSLHFAWQMYQMEFHNGDHN